MPSSKNNISKAYDYFREGLIPQAIEIFKQHQDNPDARNGLARCYQSQKRYDEAIKLLNQSIKDFPKDINGYKSLCFALFDNNQIEEAFKEARNLKQQFKNNVTAHLCEIHLLRKQNKNKEALKKYMELLNDFPKSKKVRYEICNLMIEMGEDKETIFANFRELFKDKNTKLEGWTYSDYFKASLTYGIELRNAGFYQESFEILEELMGGTGSGVRKAHLAYALGLEKSLALQKAEAAYKKTINLYPDYYGAQLLYCIFLQKNEDSEKATLNQFLQLIKKFPNGKEGHLGLSIWYLEHATVKNGYLMLAHQHAKEAIKIDPAYAAAYSQMGHCYKAEMKECYGSVKGTLDKLSLTQKVRQCYEKAVSLDKTRLERHKPSEEDVSSFFNKKFEHFSQKFRLDDEVENEIVSDKNTILTLLNNLSAPTNNWDFNVLSQKQAIRELSKEILEKHDELLVILNKKHANLNFSITDDWQGCEELIREQKLIEAISQLRKLLSTLKMRISAEKGTEYKPGQDLQRSSAATIPQAQPMKRKEENARKVKESKQEVNESKQEMMDDSNHNSTKAHEDGKKADCIMLMDQTVELFQKAKLAYPMEDFSRQQMRLAKLSKQFDEGEYDDVLTQLANLKESILTKMSFLSANVSKEVAASVPAPAKEEVTKESKNKAPATEPAQSSKLKSKEVSKKKKETQESKKPTATPKGQQPKQTVNQNTPQTAKCPNQLGFFALTAAGFAVAVGTAVVYETFKNSK